MKPVLPKPSEERKAVVRRRGNASLEREVASDQSMKNKGRILRRLKERRFIERESRICKAMETLKNRTHRKLQITWCGWSLGWTP